jgi:hypothetical protein
MDEALVAPVVKLITAVGLPTVFCGWLMTRVEKRLDEQTKVLTQIATSMAAILEHVRESDND